MHLELIDDHGFKKGTAQRVCRHLLCRLNAEQCRAQAHIGHVKLGRFDPAFAKISKVRAHKMHKVARIDSQLLAINYFLQIRVGIPKM